MLVPLLIFGLHTEENFFHLLKQILVLVNCISGIRLDREKWQLLLKLKQWWFLDSFQHMGENVRWIFSSCKLCTLCTWPGVCLNLYHKNSVNYVLSSFKSWKQFWRVLGITVWINVLHIMFQVIVALHFNMGNRYWTVLALH